MQPMLESERNVVTFS